jgi:hypothetical protein
MTSRVHPLAIAAAFAVLAPTLAPTLAAARAEAQTPAPTPAPAAATAQAPAAAAPEDQALEVTVTYAGKGEVSKQHEISIFLFTDPNITAGSAPVAVGTVEANGGAFKFTGLPPVVYIAVVYDDTGNYERQGPPPSGTPVFLHGMAAGAPEGVKAGKDAKVKVTFDDANRM